MKTSVEIKADILKAVMLEDRKEVRDIRSAIYNRVYILTVSSFALVSFVLAKENDISLKRASGCLIWDAVIILLIWLLFRLLMKDLYVSRQCLEMRQELINKLYKGDENSSDLNVFRDCKDLPSGKKRVPGVKDSELKWIPVFSTLMILTKNLVIFFIAL